MQKTVEIARCTFEGNITNYETGTAAELLYSNHYNKKTEGRRGAIYINPAFSTAQGNFYLKSIKIEGCIFIRNYGYDGHAIYIEGDESEAQISIINKVTFINNYNKDMQQSIQCVIAFEIQNGFSDIVEEVNRFSFTNPKFTDVKPYMFVEHNGQALPKTLTPTPQPINGSISDNTSSGNNNVMKFDCLVDNGYVKIYVTCQTCSIKSGIWFKVFINNSEISNVEYDDRAIFDQSTIEAFVPSSSMSYNKEINELSYVLNSYSFKYDKDLTKYNINCYIPPSSTPEPTRSSRPTMTPAMTSTPEPTSQIIILNQYNCSNGVRC